MKQQVKSGKKKHWAMLIIGIIVVAIGMFAATSFGEDQTKSEDPNKTQEQKTEEISWNGEVLKIKKSDITSVVKFYPVEVDKIKMEVLAVKASDGTIRTALNTCQICYASGRGYYKQEGNEVICQNCKNRFKLDQIEKVKGGCNPVPILKANKTEDEVYIYVTKDFLAKYKQLFLKWKKQ